MTTNSIPTPTLDEMLRERNALASALADWLERYDSLCEDLIGRTGRSILKPLDQAAQEILAARCVKQTPLDPELTAH